MGEIQDLKAKEETQRAETEKEVHMGRMQGVDAEESGQKIARTQTSLKKTRTILKQKEKKEIKCIEELKLQELQESQQKKVKEIQDLKAKEKKLEEEAKAENNAAAAAEESDQKNTK